MNEDKYPTFLNICAAVVIFLCFGGLVLLAWQCFKSNPPQTHRIVLTVSPDSVYDDAKFAYYTDSLINVINQHEHVIADRYEAFLEDKADTQKFWSMAGVLVSFILGVAGFFGFKSIKDIERNCTETVSKATLLAAEAARSESQNYLKSHLREEVLDASEVYLTNQESRIKEFVAAAVGKANQDVSDKLDDLENLLKDLEDRMDSIEKTIVSSDFPSESRQTEDTSAISENDLFG